MVFYGDTIGMAATQKKHSNPHDLFFKKSMSNPRMALEFIQQYLPDSIVEKIDNH